MTRKEAREIAFAIVFESSFHSEGLDYILENALENGGWTFSFGQKPLRDGNGKAYTKL